ncbi:MAG: hypothetical protein GX580_14795 [Candidatus Hydrogenedens sp.]|nr:PmoA family protein [Candidatus Hydrogenedentota bacterium]NLF58895.1 hypothetical protein [Candidatus Hydrogenedens sp.]
MRSVILLAAVCSLAVFPAMADLNGKMIQVKAGDTARVAVPVSVDCAEAAPEGPVTVVDSDSGAALPATLADGKLTFVVDKLAAGEDKVFSVKVDPGKAAPRVSLEKKSGEDIVDVTIDGKLFTSYHYGSQWKKPFLWPINTVDGVGVTRDFPMTTESTPRTARDHPHHKSLWSAYGEVKLASAGDEYSDLWAEGGNSGTQKAGEVTWGSGDAYGWIKSENVWVNGADVPLIKESREYRFYATPESGRLLDVKVVFTADLGDVEFKDTKEGGIVAVRMRPDICGPKAAVITNAHGDVGEETAWGKPSPWCDFSGESKEAGWLGITIFDNPGNLRFPGSWHVRNYGLMGANSFGYSYFNEKAYNKGLIPERGDHTIKQGEPLVFNYRVYVHKGDVKEAAVADRYADYATPPEANWK